MNFQEWNCTQPYNPNPSNKEWMEFAKAAWNGALNEAIDIISRDVVSDWRQVNALKELLIKEG